MHKLQNLLLLALLASASSAHSAPSLLPQEEKPAASSTSMATGSGTATAADRIPFTEAASESRLKGERDTRYLSFFISPEQAKLGGTLRLSYVNAVSIRPDDAMLAVSINGSLPQQMPIRSPQGVSSVDLKVDKNTLKPGWNLVSLTAQQHHRVDCSLDATYELWTQLDVTASGFLPVAGTARNAAATLLSAGRKEDSRTELRVIMAGDMEAGFRQSLPVVQTLALLLGRKDLKVSFASTSSPAPGIELFIGDANSAWQTPEGRRVVGSAPTGLSVQALGDGRVQVVVRGNSEQALSAGLLQALNGPFKPVLEGHAEPSALGIIKADQPGTHHLSDLGYKPEPFTGRLFRTSFQAVMPADFYPGDYGAVTLKLSAATAPKLAPGAQLLVRINDKAVTSHGLIDPNGTILKDKILDIPLRAFRPGMNTVDILAELPREEDKLCDPLVRDESKPRFLLLDETSISVPALARAGRVPDLAALAGRAYPFSGSSAFDLVVGAASPAQLSAAATLLTRLALSAGQPFAVNLVVGMPARSGNGARNQLVLSSAQTQGMAAKSARLSNTSLDGLTTASVLNQTVAEPEPSDPRALLDAFQAKTSQDRDEPGLKENLATGLQRGLSFISRWLAYREAENDPAPIKNSDVLVRLSQSQSETETAVITTVSAATDTELEQGVDALTKPAEWWRLNGGSAVVLRSTGEVVSTATGDYHFYPLADTSLSNLRRLAAAWLSDHFAFYALAIAALVSLVGLWLGYIVPRKGVRTVK